MNRKSNLRNKVIILTFRSSCLLLFALLAIITSCAPKNQNVNFKIENKSSTNIFVQYVEILKNQIGNFYGDTTTVQIDTTESQIIWETTSNVYGANNWYYSYSISINYITNTSGDTINFNSNVAHNWQLIAGDPDTYYILQINDSSF